MSPSRWLLNKQCNYNRWIVYTPQQNRIPSVCIISVHINYFQFVWRYNQLNAAPISKQ